ncbi:hypothetical protein PG994_007604 [Apiospora phragmitis]|uniref:Altered inheritance of mitochondria protein 11 n=1 Tax=Apiospora phragmitis TaxID=2905665 RepID=A0ABR1UQP4_9PEZI
MANDRDSKSESLPIATASTASTVTANATNIPETNASMQLVSTRPDTRTPIFSQRSMKQLGLFFGGAVFSPSPPLSPDVLLPGNSEPANKLDGDNSLIAVEALGLATLNVFGFGIMATGGLSWAFDVSSVAELRGMARKTLGADGSRTDEEAEREVEEWVAKMLFKKDEKDNGEQKPAKEVEKTK